jgi:hypothetical protein
VIPIEHRIALRANEKVVTEYFAATALQAGGVSSTNESQAPRSLPREYRPPHEPQLKRARGAIRLTL